MNNLVYMLHEVNHDTLFKVLKIPTKATITFDDGLYTQFLNKEYFERFKRVIFFINPTILCKDEEHQSTAFIKCADAHKKAFKGNFENYMTLNQVKELYNSGFEIGSHSYEHKYFKTLKEIKDDIEKSLNFFKNHNIKIKSYCFPYNQDSKNPLFKLELSRIYKNIEFFGSNRIPIEVIKI